MLSRLTCLLVGHKGVTPRMVFPPQGRHDHARSFCPRCSRYLLRDWWEPDEMLATQ